MKLKGALPLAAILLALSVPTAASERESCRNVGNGIKRCEATFSDRNYPDKIIKTIRYSDARKDVSEWEINFADGIDGLWPAALIGSSMLILAPSSTAQERAKLLSSLLRNSAVAGTESFSMGRYEWVSAKLGGGTMIRAIRKKGER